MKKTNYIYGLLLGILGLLLIIFKKDVISIAITICGVFVIGFGILNLLGANISFGIITILLGIIFIVLSNLIIEICLIFIGIMILVYTIKKSMVLFKVFKSLSNKSKIINLINVSILLIIGLLFIISRWKMLDIIFTFIGIILLIEGIIFIFKDDKTKKVERKFEDIFID